MYQKQHKFLYFIWIIIFFLELGSFLYECYYLNLQQTISPLTLESKDSLNYQRRKVFYSFFSRALEIIFMLFLYTFTDFILTYIHNDYEYAFFILLLQWLLFRLPASMLALNVEKSFHFTEKRTIEFLYSEILHELFLISISFITILLNHSITSFTNIFFKNVEKKEDQIENNTVNLDMNTIYHSRDLQKMNPFLIFLICYSLSMFLYFSLYIKYKNYNDNLFISTESNKKLLQCLEWIRITQNINLTNAVKVKKFTPNQNNHVTIQFGGIFKKHLIISENSISMLNSPQLIATIISNYYSIISDHNFLIYVTYIFEFFLYPTIVYFYYKGYRLSIKYFFSMHFGKTISIFYCFHWLLSLIRSIIWKYIIFNADEYCLSKNLAIADSLVKISTLNKNTIIHSHLYSFFYFNEPSLQDRLVNIAVANSQHVID